MFAKSIRLRFQLWLAFLLVVVLSGFGFTAYQLYRTSQLNEIDAQLERRLGALSSDARGGLRGPRGPGGPGRRDFGGPPPQSEDRFRNFPPDGEFHGPPPDGPFRGSPFTREIRLSMRTQNLFDEAETNSFYFAIWSRGGTVLKQSTNAPATIARPPQPDRDSAPRIQMRDDRREVFQYTEIGECILVGRSIADYQRANRRFALLLLAAGAAVLFVALGGGWALTTRAIQPIRDISATAAQISGGNLSQRIDIADTDSELGQLAHLLNSTFTRLESAFTQQKQFTADAAHELRTPLAVIISETQTALSRPRSAEEYRETVEACLETAQRMRALAHSLLELARFDAGQEQINRAPLDLAGLAAQCIDQLHPLARQRNINLIPDLEPVPINGDAERLAQALTNLLTNAINYNKPAGEVRISVRPDKNGGVLKISDTGVGISAEALPHIFERFYRADRSRTRAEGQTGLGLAISKAIVEAHNGTISVESSLETGTTFTVKL